MRHGIWILEAHKKDAMGYEFKKLTFKRSQSIGAVETPLKRCRFFVLRICVETPLG